MAKSEALYKKGFGKTSRRDAWWGTPTATAIVLTSFIVYATWAAMQGQHFEVDNYLSPFYSPVIWGESHHSWTGVSQPPFWPAWLPFSPALLILPFPALFRFTCYYYRGAYYKAMWADPPACAVGEPNKGKFKGENSFPGILQNCHRYFMVFALIFLLFLWHDAWKGFWFPVDAMGEYVPAGQGPQPDVDVKFGVRIGSLVLLLNTTLLTCYTLGCHSLRHFVGGAKKSQAGKKMSLACYTCVSGFNAKHMFFAWTSLFGVMGADLYVRLVSMEIIKDFRFF